MCQLPFRWGDRASERLDTPAELQSWLESKQQKVAIGGPVVGNLIVSGWTEKTFLESQHLVQ